MGIWCRGYVESWGKINHEHIERWGRPLSDQVDYSHSYFVLCSYIPISKPGIIQPHCEKGIVLHLTTDDLTLEFLILMKCQKQGSASFPGNIFPAVQRLS